MSPICRSHNSIHEKPKNSNKRLISLINKFRKEAAISTKQTKKQMKHTGTRKWKISAVKMSKH